VLAEKAMELDCFKGALQKVGAKAWRYGPRSSRLPWNVAGVTATVE